MKLSRYVMVSCTMTFCVVSSTILLTGNQNQRYQREARVPLGLSWGNHMLKCLLAGQQHPREA